MIASTYALQLGGSRRIASIRAVARRFPPEPTGGVLPLLKPMSEVAHTSTLALRNATIPSTRALAAHGEEKA